MTDAPHAHVTMRHRCCADARYTFTAVERSLDDDDLVCSGQSGTMLLGIMLRDPLAGIKSTWIGNELDKGAILRAMRTTTCVH